MARRKNNSSRKQKKSSSSPKPLALPVAIVPSRPTMGRKRNNNNRIEEGVVTLNRTELLTEVTSPATAGTTTFGVVELKPDSLPWLKNLASSFERYRWNSVKIFWRGACGTTFGGLIAFGIDWHGRKKLAGVDTFTRAQVTGLTPVCDVPVYTDSVNKPLVLPKNLLNSRQWYALGVAAEVDAGPGQLAYAAKHDSTTSKFLGELWITYSLTMQGSTSI